MRRGRSARRGVIAAATAAIVACALTAAVPAAADVDPFPSSEAGLPFAPWDGSVPYNCEVQDVGTGTAFPHPDADPFCVEYDKTQQNITDLGILDFALQEPIRLAQVAGKCFYFQRDHWTGSIVQGEAPELWHWDGSYVVDRGLGVVGANLSDFRILGVPFTPSAYFDLPPEFAPYFDQNGIGAYLALKIPIDPLCAPKVDTPEERAAIYAGAGVPAPAGGGGEAPPAPQAQVQAPASVPPQIRPKRKRATRCKKARKKTRSAKRKRCRPRHRIN